MNLLRKILLLLTLIAVTVLTHDLGEHSGVSSPFANSALALGFLLLFSFLVGRISKLLNGPMITGFLVAGVLAGPFGIEIVTREDVIPLKLVDDLALALIAFSAGGELKISRFKDRLKSLFVTAIIQGATAFLPVFLTFIPLLIITGISAGSTIAGIAGALLLGVIATANSPATAIAVINETGSKGPVADTIIGVTVIKDVIVIVTFGLALATAKLLVGNADGVGLGFIVAIVSEISLSFIVGAITAMVVVAYLKATDDNIPLFLLGATFMVVEVCSLFHSAPLLASIVAGFLIENASKEGEKLIEGLKTGSLPVFVVFFSLAGHGLDFSALSSMWFLATLFVVVRMLGTRFGTIWGLRLSGEDGYVGRLAWPGFISQAGVSLGFAVMVSGQFPGFGEKLASLVVAAVAVNQLAGPIMMKISLTKAGETAVIREEREKV